MRTLTLHQRDFEEAEQVHAFLARELAFPDYYGGNFAALSDCLGDVCTPLRLEVYCDGASSEAYAAWFAKLCRVLIRCALENENLRLRVHDERA